MPEPARSGTAVPAPSRTPDRSNLIVGYEDARPRGPSHSPGENPQALRPGRIFEPQEVRPQEWFLAVVVSYEFAEPVEVDCADFDEDACEEEGPDGERVIVQHCHHLMQVLPDPASVRVELCEAYPTEKEAEEALRGHCERAHYPDPDSNGIVHADGVLATVAPVYLHGRHAVETWIALNRWKIEKS